jgi:hypothetical protein
MPYVLKYVKLLLPDTILRFLPTALSTESVNWYYLTPYLQHRLSSCYEVVSKIFRTSATIHTAIMVARSTGFNRPNCEFRVLLRSFAATA